jgi:translocation and assembly module TamB
VAAAGKLALLIVGGLVGLLVVAWVSLLLIARTDWAKHRLARLAAEKATAALAGKVTAREIAVSGALDVCLRDISLEDPDGNVVLSADEACVSIEALLLPRKQARIRSARVTRPVLDVASVTDPEGQPTTTLARAVAARVPQPTQPDQRPPAWTVRIDSLTVISGSVRLRPSPGAAPSFALEDLALSGAQARYSAAGAQARLGLTGTLTAPGEAPAALDLDAQLVGGVSTGKAQLRELRLRVGKSGLVAEGSVDLSAKQGALKFRDLSLVPEDLAVFLPRKAGPGEQGNLAPPLLAGPVRGGGEVSLDGTRVRVSLALEAGGGTLSATAEGNLSDQRWSTTLAAVRVDPAGVIVAAPRGEVSLQLTAAGTGIPRFDAQGVRGDLRGKLHVGPARLEPLGPLLSDLDVDLRGRTAVVRAFTAAALGLTLRARGEAARERLALDLVIDAPRLEQVGRAVAAITRKPGTSLRGAAHLTAHLSGTTRSPNARLSLRVPSLQVGGVLRAAGIAVDGTLQGQLLRPTGALTVSSRDVRLGAIHLGGPRIALGIEWPLAHVRIESQIARRNAAGVRWAQGQLRIAGDATINRDRDGLSLSSFIIDFAGNELRLAQPASVHLRPAETVVEPIELVGLGGAIRFSATFSNATRRRPARVEAAVVASRIDLGRLPPVALPQGFHLAGKLDIEALVRGPTSAPDADLTISAAAVEVQRLSGIGANARAHLHGGRLRADGSASGPANEQLEFHADAPLENLAEARASMPFEISLALRGVDLAQTAQIAQSGPLKDAHLAGALEVRLAAQGTLATPRAVVSVVGRNLSSTWFKEGELKVGLLVEKDRAVADGQFELGGAPALSLTAQVPFELLRAVREPGYLKAAGGRPVAAELALSHFTLEQLVRAGVLPKGSTGSVTASLALSGTPFEPQLVFNAAATGLSTKKLRDLSFQSHLEIGQRIALSAAAQGGGQTLVRVDATVQLTSRELVQIARRASAARARRTAGAAPGSAQLIDDRSLAQLLDRSLNVRIAVPGLVLGRAALVAGAKTSPAEGRLSGSLEIKGTPAAPNLLGRLEVKDFSAQAKRLGNADLYVEGNAKGALLHVGIDPPGGGRFLGHAQLKAELGARALVENGIVSVRGGELTASAVAKKLDLTFLSGLVPHLRRTGGLLDADVEARGLLGRPQLTGDAHLRTGLFDVVGQGAFREVAFDAKFTPKEAVLDRLTGSLGGGTFSTVLTLAQKAPAAAGEPVLVEFTGETHLGDDESVKGRTGPDGKPVPPGPVPVRQAGEERADLAGELDFFGSYSGGLLSSTVKIPTAHLNVRQLPDKELPSLDPNPDVLLVHPGERPHPPGKEPEEVDAEQKARQAANFRAHMELDLQTLYVKAEDFEFKLQSEMRFDYDAQHPDAPKADGTVNVPRGTFSLLGRKFEIVSAKITETGGDITDPELEIKARYENPQAVVNVNVTGTAKAPQIDLSSSPPMDQDAIAFFLATGRVQGRAIQQAGGIDLSSAATSVVGGLLFGQLRKSLAADLPVDVLTIETSQGGVSQASVGKYIGDRIFVGYRQRLVPAPTENTNEGRVEYEISRSYAAAAVVGDRNSDFSILYSRDF